ncbi:MAG: formimidoylglutamate deiminase [Oligoflexus sp.]
MTCIQVEYLWQADGWLGPAWLETDGAGTIVKIYKERPTDKAVDCSFEGAMLPGFVNAHSHAFQLLMAGMAERHQPQSNDFWGWRQLMYQALSQLSPQSLKTIATTAFQQMLRHGYTHVVEFHYLQRDPKGQWYANETAMADALVEAATDVGIGLTLIPVYYHKSSFNQSIEDMQKRFYFASVDEYEALIQTLQKKYRSTPHVIIGSGVHSLRVADEDELEQLLNQPPIPGPVHLHIAEQQKEVNDCLQHWGKRPVEWLLEHVTLQNYHNLVHATHLTDQECADLSASPATVVICPSTEANLGDGIFPFAKYWDQGGRWAIGSDSQIGLCPMEELRWLDYSMRLQKMKRSNYLIDQTIELGDKLCLSAWQGSYQSAGLGQPLTEGQALNAITIDLNHYRLIGRSPEKILSTVVFTGDQSMINRVFQSGKIRYERDDGKDTKGSIPLRSLVNDLS